mmetsp:Transcript_39467/g.58608  ORF Transcript_39467/g.58608 Transcript_39467/m.58608 type:complete len:133 (+) Transcript_39467:215-613(+)
MLTVARTRRMLLRWMVPGTNNECNCASIKFARAESSSNKLEELMELGAATKRMKTTDMEVVARGYILLVLIRRSRLLKYCAGVLLGENANWIRTDCVLHRSFDRQPTSEFVTIHQPRVEATDKSNSLLYTRQ